MSRQAQNVLTGAIACVAATIAVALIILTMAGDSDELATGAAQPLAAGDVEAAEVDGEDENAVPARRVPVPPDALAVTAGPSDANGSSATDTSTGTPLAPTSATTSAVAQAGTTATGGSSSSTAAGSGGSATAVDAGSSSTTAGASTSGSTVTSTSETNGQQTTTTAARATTTRQTTDTTASTTTTAATSTSSTSAPQAPSGSLNAIEREIARLTNELRTNPNGSLKRQGPAIDCGGRVRVDLSTGLYESIGAVTVSEVASLQVARPWSAQMTRANFEHQPNAGVAALQAAGISVRSAGENIAYHNYPDKAMNHFTGWRESDGHFCNMMNPGFTHLGVGEVTKSDGISYATQNFYSTR